MKKRILKEIEKVEKKNNVKIILAVESGSRAWGFASKDSDYDIRCVHVGKLDNYLGLNKPPRQINRFEGDLDFESWDIEKFFELALKSNPQIAEWIRSPIIYVDSKFMREFKSLFEKKGSLEYLKMHYLRMAKQNYHKYMGISQAHSCKKYLYVLRAIACSKFIEKEKKLPPLPYNDVIDYLPSSAQKFFEKCVVKKNSTEKAEINSNKEVNEYIEKNLSKIKKIELRESPMEKELNRLLVKTIKEYGK